MSIVDVFSERLNELTKGKGLIPSTFEKELNIPHSTAQGWFVGKNMPNYDYLVLIANFFECTTDYLLGVTDY